jgi:hypothetical protein
MPTNTSATGGYLVPEADPLVLEGQALRRFLHGVVVGVTALSDELVRQQWQPNPPPIPGIDVDWCAFGITDQRRDFDPFFDQQDTGGTLMRRHEECDILCIFYGPNCQSYANRLADGLYVAQNRDAMSSVGMGLIGFSDVVHVPELINERWFDRADVTWSIRREIVREYPVLHFLGAYGEIAANRAETTIIKDWEVPVQGD